MDAGKLISGLAEEVFSSTHQIFAYVRGALIKANFARDHGLNLPEGYNKSRQVGQVSLYESDQARKTGLTKDDHIKEVSDAWQHHDDPQAFVRALAERGYILATGRLPYVLVDLYGGMHSLPKLIADKGAKTKDLRKFLGRDFPTESLPSVEEAQRLVAQHRSFVEKSVNADRLATELASLKHAQDERRQATENACRKLRAEQEHNRFVLQTRHRLERDTLRSHHLQRMRSIRKQRHENRPTGLAAFLGKITGVALIQSIRARRADARMLEGYLASKADLKLRQKNERNELVLRQTLKTKTVERDLKSLEKVDARERSSLQRNETAEQRIHDRGDQGMPSLEPVLDALERQAEISPARDFRAAGGRQVPQTPDVASAFTNASSGRIHPSGTRGSSETPGDDGKTDRPEPTRDRER